LAAGYEGDIPFGKPKEVGRDGSTVRRSSDPGQENGAPPTLNIGQGKKFARQVSGVIEYGQGVPREHELLQGYDTFHSNSAGKIRAAAQWFPLERFRGGRKVRAYRRARSVRAWRRPVC